MSRWYAGSVAQKRQTQKVRGRRTREAIIEARSQPEAMGREERMSIVFEYFRRGLGTKEIVRRAMEDYGLNLNREDPWRLISEAARTNKLVYLAPTIAATTDEFSRRYAWLDELYIAHTRIPADLSFLVARSLLKLIRNRKRRKSADIVRIGVSGGGSIQMAFQRFAGLLAQEHSGLPSKIVFHSLVSSLDVSPAKDSTGIYGYFNLSQDLPVDVEFVSIPAPGLVTKEQYRFLEGIDSIKEAMAWRDKLDIVVSSIGHWQGSEDGNAHSVLADQLRRKAPDHFREFVEAGAIGDYIFMPVGLHGFVDLEGFRIMSLFESRSDLSNWIKNGADVLVLAGPCGTCGKPKTEVLRCLLNQPPDRQLLTNLVVDHRTAHDLLFA